jgi:hypothetical protein
MKTIFAALCIIFVMVNCQPQAEVDNSANEAFERNSKTAMENLKGFESENVDYSQYADNFVMLGTSFGDPDSVNLEQVKKSDQELWKYFDFKIIGDVVLLPGVSADTKLPDGSVRHYSTWEISTPATDSTEAKSGIIKLYESYDFNEEGKITLQQVYGDFSGIMMYLMSDDDGEGEDDDDA